MSESEPRGPERSAGDYRLVESLGRGGFGEVFLGVAGDGTRAAVKLLHASWSQDAEMRRRFAAEVKQARRVSGFCIAPILAADPHAEQPWIASEYIEGPTLTAAVTDRGPRQGTALHRLAVSTATALVAVHGAGVVHRDLKPDNILLAADGPRVIDFGIARAVEASSVTASGVVGTVGYMAPEQLEGARLSAAVDVFAWGAVLVYAATGREAFAGPTQAARATRILTGDPDTGDLGEPLLPVVLACLAKDPAQRPSARELLDMLLGVAASGPAAQGQHPPAPEPEAAAPEGDHEPRRGAPAADQMPAGDGHAADDAQAATRAAAGAADAAPGGAREEPGAADAATRLGPAPTRVETSAAESSQQHPGTLRYTSLAPGGTRAAPGSKGAQQVPDAPPRVWPGSAPASPPPAGPSGPAESQPQTPPPAGSGAPGDSGPSGTVGPSGAFGQTAGTPPYWFAGVRCTDPGALAEAMQREWTAAVHVFSDEQERAALGTWLVEDIGDTATDRSLFRRRPDDANRTVAWFIVQHRPDLPPVFRGRPASIAELHERFAQVRPAFTGAPPDNEQLLLARVEVLNLLALHEGPDSAKLRRLADGMQAGERAAAEFRGRLERAVPRLAQRASVDSALILALLLRDQQAVVDAEGHPEVEQWFTALWSAVEREQGAAAIGASAAALSVAGEARASALRSAEWNAALVTAEQEREEAADRLKRAARVDHIALWVGRSPLLFLVLAVVLTVAEAVSTEDLAGPLTLWSILFLGVWVLSRIASRILGAFSGPREGFPSATHAAQARFHRARDHAAQLGRGLEQMQSELQAVRQIGGG